MVLFFDDGKEFIKDLDNVVIRLDRWNNPIVVLPTERDVKTAEKIYHGGNYDHVTFITYDYWLSKKWIADGDYDHIDFFRVDQFFISRSYGTTVGCATMRRTKKRIKEEE